MNIQVVMYVVYVFKTLTQWMSDRLAA